MHAYQRFFDCHRAHADIYLVYILEAHFVDKDAATGAVVGGWPIGRQYNYPQTKTLDERRAMVDLLVREYHPTIPVLIDTLDNAFQHAYHPWPDKAVVLLDGVIQYMSMQNEDGSRNGAWTDEIEQLLPRLLSTHA